MTESAESDLATALAMAATIRSLQADTPDHEALGEAIFGASVNGFGLLSALHRCVLSGLMADRLYRALCRDLSRWQRGDRNGFFDETCETFESPVGVQAFTLVAELRTPNSGQDGASHFELLVGRRHSGPQWVDPPLLGQAYITPIDIIAASEGYSVGNCLVIFPEMIVKRVPTQRQHFGLSIVNKFPKIFRECVLASLRHIHVPGLSCPDLSDEQLAAVRHSFVYFHEFYHQSIGRPIASNVRRKNSTYAALLEEARVDVELALAGLSMGGPGIQLAEVALLDRIVRMPRERFWRRSPDAGAGLLIFSALERAGCIGDGGFMPLDAWVAPLAGLAGELRALDDEPDEDYDGRCQKLVARWLPTVNDGGFSAPTRYIDIFSGRDSVPDY